MHYFEHVRRHSELEDNNKTMMDDANIEVADETVPDLMAYQYKLAKFYYFWKKATSTTSHSSEAQMNKMRAVRENGLLWPSVSGAHLRRKSMLPKNKISNGKETFRMIYSETKRNVHVLLLRSRMRLRFIPLFLHSTSWKTTKRTNTVSPIHNKRTRWLPPATDNGINEYRGDERNSHETERRSIEPKRALPAMTKTKMRPKKGVISLTRSVVDREALAGFVNLLLY